MLRLATPTLLVGLAACGINPAFEEPRATSTDPGTTAPLPTTAPDPGLTSAADDPTDTGGGLTEALTSGPPLTTTATSPPDDTTTSTTTGDTSSTSSDDATTDAPPESEHLQRYNPDNCDEPLWCYANGNIYDGLGVRVGSQECFTPAVPRPYRLTRLDYVVAGSIGEMTGHAKLEIHIPDGDGPDELLTSIPLENVDLLLGTREYVFDAPVEIDADTFCVGFVAGRNNPKTALGLAVDTSALLEGHSYIRVNGDGGCDHPDWTDISELQPNPTGGWCIAADVEH